MKSTLEKIGIGVAESFLDLDKNLTSDEQIISFLATLGWDFKSVPASNLQPFKNLRNLVSAIEQALSLYNAPTGTPNLSQLFQTVNTFYTGVKSLANATYDPALTNGNFSAIIVKQLTDSVLLDYIAKTNSSLFHLLKILGIIQIEYVEAAGNRLSYFRKVIDFNVLGTLFQNPLSVFENVYGWGTNNFDFEEITTDLLDLLNNLGFDTRLESTSDEDVKRINNLTELPSYATNLAPVIRFINVVDITGLFEAGIKLNQLFADATKKGGISIMPFSTGGFNKDIELFPGLNFKIASNIALTNNAAIKIRPQVPAEFVPDIYNATSGLTASGQLSFGLIYSPTIGDSKNILLSLKDGSKIVYDSVSTLGGINLNTSSNSNYFVELNIVGLQFILNSNEGDGFIKKMLPSNGIKTPLNLTVGYSNQNKFYFKGSTDLNINIPLKKGNNNNNNNNGFDLESGNININGNNGLNINVGITAKVKLGPFVATIEQVGLGFNFTFPANGGNLGPVNAEIGFKPPSGVGILIDSETVKGGGYLFFDAAKGQYAGVAELNIKDKINLKAIGILTTKNDPVTGADYSLLFIITAEFKPINLGMGFTLNGVGGLIGIHRTINEQRLRQGVQDNSLSYILFPANPVANAPQIIAAAGQAFPIANGRYAFGLMGKIGWGTPNIITLDIGLILEVPSPVRLAILGVLRAILPHPDKQVLKLQVNFLGLIDFGKKQISFDASLFDSRVLTYSLTGDMAFRLYQGAKPVFLITAGGFHPSFTPPPHANLPVLRRLTLAIADSSSFKLILTSYFAITSNTVQFGSRLDLRAELPGPFVLVGYLSFDALFQFNPFKIILDIGAGVAIKKGSKSVLSLQLWLHVEGPGPWRVKGKVEFEIFWIEVSFSINKTFGNYENTQRLDNVDVKAEILKALKDTGNWEVINGAKTYDLVTVKKIDPQPDRLFVNPAGELVVRQKVAPFNLMLDRYSNSKPVNGNKFDIIKAEFGQGADKLTFTPADLLSKGDYFAVSQYQTLSDERRLTAPSFELFKNGIGFKITSEYRGGPGHPKAFAYELVVLEAEDTGGTVPAEEDGSIFRSSAADPVAKRSYSMSAGLFDGLTRNSSVVRSDLSQERNSPSRLAPDAVFWDEDRYTVARKSDLSFYEAGLDFPTRAEAEDFYRETIGLFPGLENELQVLPTYQAEEALEPVI